MARVPEKEQTHIRVSKSVKKRIDEFAGRRRMTTREATEALVLEGLRAHQQQVRPE